MVVVGSGVGSEDVDVVEDVGVDGAVVAGAGGTGDSSATRARADCTASSARATSTLEALSSCAAADLLSNCQLGTASYLACAAARARWAAVRAELASISDACASSRVGVGEGAADVVVDVNGRPPYCLRLLAWMSTCTSRGCSVLATLPRLEPSFISAPSQECARPMAWPSSWVIVMTRLSM
mgnify:CR=1 FL=1